MINITEFFKNNYLSLQVITMFFKVLTLAPFTTTIRRASDSYKNNRLIVNTSYSLAGSIYNLFISFAFMVAVIYLQLNNCINNENLREINNNDLKKLHKILVEISIPCTSIMIVLFFWMKQKKLVSIINKIICVNNELKENLICRSNLNDVTHQISIVLLQIIMIVIIHIRISTSSNDVCLNYSVVTGFIIEGLMLQYALIVNFLRKLIYSLNESLLLITNQVGRLPNEFLPSDNDLYHDNMRNLTFIKKMNRAIYEIIKKLSGFYSFPVLFAIIFSCLWMIMSAYIVIFYYEIKSHSNSYDFYRLLFASMDSLWPLKDFFPIVILTSYITKTITELKRTEHIVLRVKHTFYKYPRIKSQMENFAMELTHRQYTCFSACHFFLIDNTLLIPIISTTATYLIILLKSNFSD